FPAYNPYLREGRMSARYATSAVGVDLGTLLTVKSWLPAVCIAIWNQHQGKYCGHVKKPVFALSIQNSKDALYKFSTAYAAIFLRRQNG
ncbi:hypothetical protein, partial [Escherichia coli]|uniref:hypothetical protein n=1 Tax=Escherichia coli TaxID=562 RepID=UPI001BC8675E